MPLRERTTTAQVGAEQLGDGSERTRGACVGTRACLRLRQSRRRLRFRAVLPRRQRLPPADDGASVLHAILSDAERALVLAGQARVVYGRGLVLGRASPADEEVAALQRRRDDTRLARCALSARQAAGAQDCTQRIVQGFRDSAFVVFGINHRGSAPSVPSPFFWHLLSLQTRPYAHELSSDLRNGSPPQPLPSAEPETAMG